jgi:hypothetical protein
MVVCVPVKLVFPSTANRRLATANYFPIADRQLSTDNQQTLMHDDLTIPKWFLRLMSCVLGLAVPWAGWVTLQLATIEVKVEQAAEASDQLYAHLADPDVHHAGVQRLDGRLGVLERRIEAVENR